MKKLIGILAISALAVSAFAQGTIVVANQTGLVKQWTSASDQTPIPVPKGGGYVQVVAAPKGAAALTSLFSSVAGGYQPHYDSLAAFLAANPAWKAAKNDTGEVPGAIGLGAGLFSAGIYTITGIAPGGSADYAVLGWTGAFTSWDAAYAAAALPGSQVMMGMSATFTTATGDPTATPPGAAVFLRPTFGGMTLAPVVIPEPASFALAGLGLAALLVFRRRNS